MQGQGEAAGDTMALEDRHRTDARPRYQQTADALRARIASGEFALGSLLPTENDLCAAYGISRHTVREALRLLTEAGLIQRRQGSGSLVIATQEAQGYVHAMRSLNELFQYAADTSLIIHETVMQPPAPEIGAEGGEPWLLAEGLRLDPAGQVPICFSLIYINPAFAAIRPDLTAIRGAIYSRIESLFGVEVTEVEQLIRAEPLPPAATAALGQKAKSVGVRVIRRYLDVEGRLLLASVNYHPAERFSYSMRLRREGIKAGWA